MALSYFPSAAAARNFLDTTADRNIPYTIAMLEKVRTTLEELGETKFGKSNKKEVKRVLDNDALAPTQDPHLNTNKDGTFKGWRASAAASYFFGAFVSAAPGRIIETRDNRCDQCIKAFGQRSHGRMHTECITLSGELWGGCTNCYYSSHKGRCSKSTWVKGAVYEKVAGDEEEAKEVQDITEPQSFDPILPEVALGEGEAHSDFGYSASLNKIDVTSNYEGLNMSLSEARTIAIRRGLANGHGEGPNFDPLGNFIRTYKHRDPRPEDEYCFPFTPGFLYPAEWDAYVSEILQGRVISPPNVEQIWKRKWEWLRHREEMVSEYERLHRDI